MGDLRKHIKAVHLGDRPYVCEVNEANWSGCACGRRFTTKYSLNRHQQRLHEVSTTATTLSLLDRDVAELRQDPSLWDAFIEALEKTFHENQALYRSDVDELLVLCTALSPKTDPEFPVAQEGPADDPYARVYLRLIRVLRRRRPETCGELLSHVINVIKAAEAEYTLDALQRDKNLSILRQVYEALMSAATAPRSSMGFRTLLNFGPSELVGLEPMTDLVRILRGTYSPPFDIDESGWPTQSWMQTHWAPVTGNDGFSSLQARKVLQWASGLRHNSPERNVPDRNEAVPPFWEAPKAFESIREALFAADCCKSIASGHTNSTMESVYSLPLQRNNLATHEIDRETAISESNGSQGTVIVPAGGFEDLGVGYTSCPLVAQGYCVCDDFTSLPACQEHLICSHRWWYDTEAGKSWRQSVSYDQGVIDLSKPQENEKTFDDLLSQYDLDISFWMAKDLDLEPTQRENLAQRGSDGFAVPYARTTVEHLEKSVNEARREHSRLEEGSRHLTEYNGSSAPLWRCSGTDSAQQLQRGYDVDYDGATHSSSQSQRGTGASRRKYCSITSL
ncbi:uncharacterized protein HMPREF1541_07403 [Cyphellophora europaea CBS 101466]|uniref:C2H2-type domain-containing protein n=1 Tax=Cyphellophora europaea (strain CBS 101466) TaxID=1220924 RepID=W2RN64_CYPE1|nr:uncharacterized protein HMPREF1541_07403 [Cyphellophora europaea CBS 101466]ETN37780.1 hypothetical protein HMPREF1541_07403 [Cyphellophora europaea CBS 101466]